MDTSDAAAPAGADRVSAMLRESKELAVVQLSPDGIISGWFGAAEHIFGYAGSEIVGQPLAVLFVPQDRNAGIADLELELARQTGRAEDDRWHLRRDGAAFWASGVLVRQCDAAGRLVGFYKLLRDRTDLRMRYDTLHSRVQACTAEAARHDEARLTLLHELRNALGPMLGAAWVLQGSTDETLRARGIETLVRQVPLLKRLIEEASLPDLSRRSPLELRCVPLKEALATAVDGLREEARRQQVDMQLFMPSGLVMIEADPDRLQQMLLNLLSNAVKYTPPGGCIVVSMTVDAESALIRIADTGVGIDPDNLVRIFELFTRETQGADTPTGLGIGLAIGKRYAMLHGGFVEARSPGKGKGSQFTLQLPLRQPDSPR